MIHCVCNSIFTYYFYSFSIIEPVTTENPNEVRSLPYLSLMTLHKVDEWCAHCLNWYVRSHQAPCRKLLTTLILDLEAHLFDTQHDIYMPNCDKRGFFRKKQVSAHGQITVVVDDLYFCVAARTIWFPWFLLVQCWSSRGKRRGKCWCVDINGLMVPSKGRHKGSLVCWRPSNMTWTLVSCSKWFRRQELHQRDGMEMKELQQGLMFPSTMVSKSNIVSLRPLLNSFVLY